MKKSDAIMTAISAVLASDAIEWDTALEVQDVLIGLYHDAVEEEEHDAKILAELDEILEKLGELFR